jgi:hypothetical protein
MSIMSSIKVPRPGQAAAIEAAASKKRSQLNAQLPTGYGKTFTATSIYARLQQQGRVNRLLYIVPSDAQLLQFVQEGRGDLADAGVEGSHFVCDIAYSGSAVTLRQHRMNSHQVFACTIQALTAGRVGAIVKELMQTGLWMICVDEYHHYGFDCLWGKTVLALPRQFLLAMSATPYRPDDDSAFGPPDVAVSYRDAVKEGAVKPLTCHSYDYRIDALEENGEVSSYTISTIVDKAGSDSPNKVEKIFRDMRWSPKYVSPLVEAPIERMMLHRIETGHNKLQVLVGAMCCSHAELVCKQIKEHIDALYPGQLNVDWVGTGHNGRSDAENRSIIKKFCPDKVDGRRRPEDIKLDILVHVGMAGEGLDTVFVSDVVHLNTASLNNSNRQENGRAARFLPGVTGVIHVDSSSDFHEFVGPNVELSFDYNNTKEAEDDGEELVVHSQCTDIKDLPEEPNIRIYDMECIRIIKSEVEVMAKAMIKVGNWSDDLLSNESFIQKAEDMYRQMKHKELEDGNDRAIVAQWKEMVGTALGHVTTSAIRAIYGNKGRMPSSMAGEIKRKINTRKKREIGAVDQDVALLKQHYQWLNALNRSLKDGDVPQWLL